MKNVKYHKIRLKNEMKKVNDNVRKNNGGEWERSENMEMNRRNRMGNKKRSVRWIIIIVV